MADWDIVADARPSRSENRASRSFAGGLAGLALLISVLVVGSTADTSSIFGTTQAPPPAEDVQDVSVPTVQPSSEQPSGVQRLRTVITCFPDQHCLVEVANGDSIRICPEACNVPLSARPDEVWVTANPNDATIAGENVPVIWGIERVDREGRGIRAVPVTEARPAEYLQVRYDTGELMPQISELGDAGMQITRRDTPIVPSSTSAEDIGEDSNLAVAALWVVLLVFAGALVIGMVGFAIAEIVDFATSRADEPDKSDDDDEQDVPEDVTAPIELDVLVTSAQAEERVQVVRDLLDAVRAIEDPRDSIQRGYATLETGFGRPHLARMKNETAARYLARILGDSRELREPMMTITSLFERARFSELPIDDAMRTAMIDSLEAVQHDWEARAFALTGDAIPSPAERHAVPKDRPSVRRHR